jgi:predicted nucleic-acid-binding Zn-ribbon protein
MERPKKPCALCGSEEVFFASVAGRSSVFLQVDRNPEAVLRTGTELAAVSYAKSCAACGYVQFFLAAEEARRLYDASIGKK